MITALMLIFTGMGLMALVSIFYPKAAFFLKNPTRFKAMSSWAGLCFLVFLIIVFGFRDELKDSSAQAKTKTEAIKTEANAIAEAKMDARIAAASEAMRAAPTGNASEKEREDARTRMAQKTPLAQAEIKKLYDELLVMRNTMEFKELGFSGKNKTSNEWKSRVAALNERMKADDDIPVIVKAAPSYIIGLGMEKAWRQGNTTADSKWNTQMVQDALSRKLEE